MIRSKTLRVAAAGFLAAAGLALVASPAGADDSSQESMHCQNARAQGKLNPGITFAGQQLKATTSLFKDLTNPLKPPIGGSCTANFQLGGSIASNGGKGSAGTVPGTLTPIGMSANLNGFGSCDQSDPPPTAASYPLNGQVSLKMSQINGLGKNWAATTYLTTAGFVDGKPDVVQIVGMGTKGLGAGAQVSGQFYFDPIKKPKKGVDYITSPTEISSYDPKTGMMLDVDTALACALNAGGTITLVEVGTGTPSLLGTVVDDPGLTWQLPSLP